MEHVYEYPGPTPDDYLNVVALNTAFVCTTSNLKGPQRGRLAAAPFLLFSLRENDAEWWAEILSDPCKTDMLAVSVAPEPHVLQLQTAAVGFLWQLARRNPYAARIISGATVSWCENIGDLPLVTLLDRIAGRDDLMTSRIESPVPHGGRLLGNGTSSRSRVRRSSQLTVLQSLLARTGLDGYAQVPAAACSLSVPVRAIEKKS